MDQNQTSVGANIAQLYDSIAKLKQQKLDIDTEITSAQNKLVDYLKQIGVYNMLQPDTDKAEGFQLTSPEGKTKRTRQTKTADQKADEAKQVELNKLVYKGKYPNGINATTGLPVKYKGRDARNEEILAMMKDDEREYASSQSGEAPAAPAAKKSAAKK
ncbi:hypothetical protein [Hymenobacter sp. APR13]|uniref:hypothetical protein n=1 Tax=Hymenobacter sp. APR13 TaxID=1356852 RepID=UPI0004E093C0|nr:hypothetical protein [Hymenobacter sp. APR13]AII50395.1 hypothetical protein N008_00160 [Hymenobacter sp. APR13]